MIFAPNDVMVGIPGRLEQGKRFTHNPNLTRSFLTMFNAQYLHVGHNPYAVYDTPNTEVDDKERAERVTTIGFFSSYGKGGVPDIIKLDVDILIPAAIPNLIIAGDVDNVKARLIVEGSNIPIDAQTEALLHRKGVTVVPDFVANAGGVISSYVEYTNGSSKEMFKMVEEKISKNTKLILEKSDDHTNPREAAMKIATERVLKECEICQPFLGKKALAERT